MDNDEPLLLFSTSAELFDTFPIEKLHTSSFMFPLKPPLGLAYVSTVIFLSHTPESVLRFPPVPAELSPTPAVAPPTP